jgi:hypothetical protein
LPYDFAVLGHYSENAMNGLRPATAFLIQFRTDGDQLKGRLAGRIEHVASGKTANFDSVLDVPELLRQMLKEANVAEL